MFDLKTATISDEPDSYEEFVKILEKRGEQKGKQEGESEFVIRLLKRRCGIFSMTLENQVRSLSIPQLESLGEALLDFQSLADLENWLEQNLE